MNYGNRNATSTYTYQDISKSYSMALFSSISVSLAIRKALSGKTANMSGSLLIVYNSISTFFACSTAGFLNAYFMRQSELSRGIEITDPGNPEQPLGVSKAAAQKAVTQTAISRYILNVPIILPSLVFLSLEKMRLMPKAKSAQSLVQAFVFYLELYLAVPIGVSVYPQYGRIPVSEVEPEF